jgi:hypothetical protein
LRFGSFHCRDGGRIKSTTMGTHPLDNPVWSSLTTKHASLAVMRARMEN